MSDPFKENSRSLTSPASMHFEITPNADSDLPVRPRVLYCAAAGTATIRDQGGTDVTYTLSAGQILPLSPLRVLAASATLIGWW